MNSLQHSPTCAGNTTECERVSRSSRVPGNVDYTATCTVCGATISWRERYTRFSVGQPDLAAWNEMALSEMPVLPADVRHEVLENGKWVEMPHQSHEDRFPSAELKADLEAVKLARKQATESPDIVTWTFAANSPADIKKARKDAGGK